MLAGWRSAAPGPGSNTEMIIPAGPGPRQYIEMHTATIMGSWAGGGGGTTGRYLTLHSDIHQANYHQHAAGECQQSNKSGSMT